MKWPLVGHPYSRRTGSTPKRIALYKLHWPGGRRDNSKVGEKELCESREGRYERNSVGIKIYYMILKELIKILLFKKEHSVTY